MKKYIKKYWQAILVGVGITLVIIVLLMFLSALWNSLYRLSDETKDYMFSTGDGHHFQWVGISTILAVIAFIFNAIWNKKNFNADIKSKSRIDWMKTVRDNYSEFLAISKEIFEILTDKEKVSIKNKTENELSKPELSHLNEISMKLFSIHNKLILYVPEKSNELITGAVDDVFVYTENMISKYNKSNSTNVYRSDRSYMDDYIDKNYEDIFVMNKIAFEKQGIKSDSKSIRNIYNISDENNFKHYNFTSFLTLCNKMGADYFQKEWKRAKKGK